MKYKRMALAACALLLLLSATNLSAVLTDEHPRYHQHLERPAYTPCADHGEDLLCSHLPLVLIDTGGAEIPGVPIRDGDGSRSNDTFTTTADGSTLLRASVSVVDHAEGNNHPADAPTLQSTIDIRVRGNSSRYFDKHSYLISAYPSGALDSGAMRRQVLLCTIEHDGAERAIYVGFTNALTPELAGALAQALENLSGAESIGVLADYTNSSGAEAYRTRWLITLAALIAAMLAAAVALIVFARKKRAEQKTNALIDPRYGIGNDRFYLHCVETLLPAPLRSIVYVICIGCDMPSLEHRCGEAEREELFCRAAEFLRRGCAREDYLACVGRGMFALVCPTQQPRGGTAARRGAYPRAGRLPCGLPRRICRRVPRGHLLAGGKPGLQRRGRAL